MDALGSESHFQAQLSTIMDMLAKSAAAEIGKLVEESHAMLRLEISQRRSENETLKSKCNFLEVELKATRRRLQASVDARFNSGSKEGPHRPTIDGVFGKEWCLDLWKEKEASARQKDDRLKNPCLIEPIDLIEESSEPIVIKDEMYEDCSRNGKLQADSKNSEKGAAFPSTNANVGHSSEDFIPYSGPLENSNLEQRPGDEQPFDPRPSAVLEGATSSNINIDEFGGFFNSNMNLGMSSGNKPSLEPRKFECVFCGKNFNYLSYLKVHLRTHSGEKPFVCSVCGRRFAQKTYLKIHMRTHSGERPYTCIECGKSFSQKSSLNIHLRSHTGEKPYSCVDCGKRYAYKHGFNTHQCSS